MTLPGGRAKQLVDKQLVKAEQDDRERGTPAC